MKQLTLQEARDILVGCTILGTGGGGALETGLEMVEKELQAGGVINLLDFDEIQDSQYYVSPYFCGCIKPEGEVDEITGDELPEAVRALEAYMGVDFHGLVSIEYGGGNTGDAMAAAARMGKYLVDADAAGRAVPELQFSTYYVTEKPITPFSVTTKYGDVVIVPRVRDDARAEALSRFMAVGSDDLVGIADHPILGEQLKKSVIPGALSYAGQVGRAQREAAEAGQNALEAILQTANGRLLFEGVVSGETNWEIRDGFTYGNIYLSGENAYEGKHARVWYKNENMLCWIDDEVALTCPDLICIVDTATGYPLTNPNCTAGKQLSVLGFRCHELWRRERALEILNPRFFGFDIDCKGL